MDKENREYTHTAYDDAFRILEEHCDDALIRLVNHIFHEDYDSSAKIKRFRSEHFVEKQGTEDEKRITDSHFSISYRGTVREYQIECESRGFSRTILVRIFEYAVQTALDNREETHTKLRVCLPHSALLVLRNEGAPPERMELEVVTPGGAVSYDVPVICEADYSIDDLFEKKLYFLLPFYFFNHEKQMDEYEGVKSRTYYCKNCIPKRGRNSAKMAELFWY